MANQVLSNVRGFQLRNFVAMNRFAQYVAGSHKAKTILLVTGAFAAVFLWATVLSANRASNTSANFSDSRTTPITESVPDPIAPAVADDLSHAAPPSGQASSSVSIESVDGSTAVTINGQKVEVPPNSSTSQTYTTSAGEQSNVNVSNTTTTGTGSNHSSSFTHTNINSHSSSSSYGNGDNSQQYYYFSGGTQ